MLASDILGFADLRRKTVTVPQWDKDVTVQELGLEEGMALFGMIQGMDEDNPRMTGRDIAQVVAWGVVDDCGERVFSDEDVPKLARKNRDALMLLYKEITSLSSADDAKN